MSECVCLACVCISMCSGNTHSCWALACLLGRQTDRWKEGMEQERVKNSFSFLCLCQGIWALTALETCVAPPPLHPSASLYQGSSSGRHAGVCSLCPFRAGMAVCLEPFPVQKQASDSCAWAGVPSRSATSRLIGGGFIVEGPYQLSTQTQGESTRRNYGFI